MQQYNTPVVTGMPAGCLHVSTDGVQAKASGEVNQYFALAPARDFDGTQELGAWLPLQVVGLAQGVP